MLAGLLAMPTIAAAQSDSLSDCSADNSSPAEVRPSLGQSEGDSLGINRSRTYSFEQPIGRIEVSQEDVIRVTAPSGRSLRITGLQPGQAQLTVFGTDGAVLREQWVHVGDPAAGTGQKIVAVDIQFAAVSDTTLKELGFNFAKLSGDIKGAVVSPSNLTGYSFGSTGSTTATTSGLNVTASTPFSDAFNLILGSKNVNGVISALAQTGLSQLLAQPTLLVRSGEKACFLAGGEFPVPVPQASGSSTSTLTIQYKKFGVSLNVSAWVLSQDHIVLKLAPQVSELDYTNGVQLSGYTVPGIRTRSAETTVELGSGQSFVIAGLNYSTSTVTKNKVPFLGDLPVLGAFFKSQSNSKERQELIIVATPRLVEPTAEPPKLKTVSDAVDPSIGQMIVGNDGIAKADADFGVMRR